MNEALAEYFLEDALAVFRKYKKLAEDAMAQLDDEQFFARIDAEANSVALIVKHLAGNMRSRWTDFLTADGEKPDRDRDAEFRIEAGTTREEVLNWWEAGWRSVFAAVEPLDPSDLVRTVTIRGEPHTVVKAINRQLTHYAYHVGQIVLLAKHFKSENWESLSIAPGASEAFNQSMRGGRETP
ncbi:MAG: DUF1572 domain-containing protein [Acidobacteria bacterium]|nr:DUF1572 domain-containing protein [Acidobacteriota bacterium]